MKIIGECGKDNFWLLKKGSFLTCPFSFFFSENVHMSEEKQRIMLLERVSRLFDCEVKYLQQSI